MTLGFIAAHSENLAMAVIVSKVNLVAFNALNIRFGKIVIAVENFQISVIAISLSLIAHF